MKVKAEVKVANICELNKEPKIEYPNFWEYKVIFEKDQNAHKIVLDIVGDREHKLVVSKSSKEGKYTSYNLSVIVNSNEERLELFSALRHVSKYVL
nr:DUF493 domain-containing protein [Campylobacter sp. RM16190]